MLRTSVILVASFGLLAGCATSSANSSNTNPPDAGKVDYDVGQSGGGDGGAAADPGDGGAAKPAIQGRDSTSTKGAGVAPKVAKRVATTKPPKPEEPAETKPAPKRKGRVDPHGLLGEAFAIPAGTDKLPDFAGLAGAKPFLVQSLDSSTSSPLTGLPKGTAAPVALRFTGSLNVLTAAEYQLCVNSVDGSQLLIEDTLIVDNDGLKNGAPAQLCELVSLDAGEYKVEVRSFHVSGPIVVQLAWAEGKDATPVAVPMRSLYKPEGADDRVKAGAAAK